MGTRFLSIILFLIAFPALAQETPKDAAPTPKQETCKVSGMVVKLAGSTPLKSADVVLTNVGAKSKPIAAATDSDGRFAFKDVPPGSYRLAVSRRGFVDQQYGQKSSNDPGSILTLVAGQEVKDLLFRLSPWGVIAGRIFNEDGEPLPWVQVSAMREAYADGKRKLSSEVQASTNDLGEYRLFGLRPGRYIVSATFSSRDPGTVFTDDNADSVEEEPSGQGYVPTYYPGSPDPSKASAIAVKSGDEIPSVDIFLQRALTYKIRGHVYNSITHRPGKDVSLMILPRDSQAMMGIFGVFGFNTNTQDKDGAFVLNDILPGSYYVIAFWAEEGKTYSARQSVDVGNADVEGVSLMIGPGTNVNGRLIWDGKPALERDQLEISASSAEGFDFMGEGERVLANGTFTLKDLSDDTYHLFINGMSKDSYIKALRYGSSNALYDGFTVQRGSDASLEVTLSSRGARVQGTVTDADGLPLAGVWVVLVPEPAHRSQMELYKDATTDQYGHFELRGIPLGDYKLFSWDEVENGAWQDPDFLKPFEPKGQEISFKEGDQKTLTVTAIPTRAITPEKQ